MRRLIAVAVISSVMACIDWPSDEAIRQRRCAVEPLDCALLDGGADSGVVGGTDAGRWAPSWVNGYDLEPVFLVGGGSEGTLVGFRDAGSTLQVRGVTTTGSHLAESFFPAARPTAAYQRQDLVALGLADRSGMGLRRQGADYLAVSGGPVPFVITALNIYTLPDAGLASATYGEQDGGLGVISILIDGGVESGTHVACSTSVMRPQRIIRAVNDGPGVVAGNVAGMCSRTGFTSINSAGGGFIGRFGAAIANGYSFPADPGTPMTLGNVLNEMLIAYRALGGNELRLATVGDSSLTSQPVLLGGAITPVDIVDVPGAGFLVIGHASGSTLSTLDGGSVALLGSDVFIARFDDTRQVTELKVFNYPGDQTAVGAIWLDPRLIVGGACGAGSAGAPFCADAGAYVFGVEVP